MLFFSRTIAMPGLGADYAIFDVAHSQYRVRVVAARNLILDESLLYPQTAWTGCGDRPRLDLILGGDARVRDGRSERWLGAGDFSVARDHNSLFLREQGADFLATYIEWNRGSLGTRAPDALTDGTLPAAELAHAQTLARGLLACGNDVTVASRLVADLLARLAAQGLPFDPCEPGDLVEDVEPVVQGLASALGRKLSALDVKPMLVDFEQELGLSRRQLLRIIGALTQRYGLNGTDWMSLRSRWRVNASLLLMTAPGARTEEVARAVGFATPGAFCNALHERGLPSPGHVPAAIAALL
jgi:AraC-like DNA-binding protein